MKKFALLFLVALSSGLMGCASLLEKDWGLKEEGDGCVSGLTIEIGELGRREPYCVTVVYCGKEGKTRVSEEIYRKLVLGQVVKLKLFSAIMKNESGASGERFCDATYWWWVPDVTDDGYRLITFRQP